MTTEITPVEESGRPAPPGYETTSSTIKGISAFKPKPAPEASKEPVTFKCPNCGASTRYDVAAGGIACEYCGYSKPPTSPPVGRAAKEYEFTLETLEKAAKGWGVERRELACESCGASLWLDENSMTITCPFCGSNRVHLREEPTDLLRPGFLIAFRIKPEDNKLLVKKWLGEGWFHPKELSTSVRIDQFVGIYLPFWTFDAEVISDWTAEVGYERQERYYDPGAKEWRTRTVIDWRWEKGRVTSVFDDIVIQGSSHISRVLFERLLPFKLSELVSYLPEYIAGWQAHAYDVTLTTAWEQGKTVMRQRSKDACMQDIPSPHVRNFSMVADFNDESWRYVLLPIYLAAFPYEEKVFQVMVNGQTGIVSGQKPVAWWKVWLAIAALLSPGLLFCLLGLPLMLIGGAGMIFLVLGLIFLVIGGAISFSIYRQAISSESI